MQKPRPGPWGHAGSSPGAPQPEPPGSRMHAEGTGDRDGDPAVSPSWPRPPHPPCCRAGRGVMGKAARNRDTARAIPSLSPPAAATAMGTATSHPQSAEKAQMPLGPPCPQHLPDAGVPPGRAAAPRQHRPAPAAPVAVAGPSPAVAVPAGTASCHPAAPLFSCLGFPSPMVPAAQSRIVPPTAPRGDARVCSRPRATTPDPAATAGDSPGGQEPLPRGWRPINPPRFSVNDLRAVSVAGGGPGPL